MQEGRGETVGNKTTLFSKTFQIANYIRKPMVVKAFFESPQPQVVRKNIEVIMVVISTQEIGVTPEHFADLCRRPIQ